VTMELVRPVEQQRRCALYRHFDSEDILLYVGITDNLGDRTNGGHARTSDWVQFAVRAEAEWFDSREQASKAEREAVQDEQPIYNRQYAEGDPDAKIAEYRHFRETQALKETLKAFTQAVSDFLEMANPDDVKEARLRTEHDYHCAGIPVDAVFPTFVLRRLGQIVRDRTLDVEDGASADAYKAVIDFVAAKLQEIRDRRNPDLTEPPF
jgi:hypothetical protein